VGRRILHVGMTHNGYSGLALASHRQISRLEEENSQCSLIAFCCPYKPVGADDSSSAPTVMLIRALFPD
jgi:hypothetical protein